MKNWLASCVIGSVCAAFLVASPARAVPLTWTLHDFVFDDGGTASGSYVYDAASNTYSGIAITTTVGVAPVFVPVGPTFLAFFPGGTYDAQLPAFGGASNFFSGINSANLPNLTGATAFIFALVGSMTDGGGTILVDTGPLNPPEGTCQNAECNAISSPQRTLISGDVFATPEASPVPGPVVGAGIPGLVMAFGGFLAWRRRKQAA